MEKVYETYKKTNHYWYPTIPKKWKVCKVKHIAKTYAGGTPSTVKAEYWNRGNIPWLPSGKLQNGDITKAEKFITEKGLNGSSTKWIKENTVLVALTGATCANIGYLKFKACANQSVVAIDEFKDKANSRFLYFMFLMMRKQILTHQTGGAQAGINDGNVKNLYLLLPSLKEQTQIAAYLDYHTQLIDTLISKKETLIQKLKEQRQAIINEAVTKGLNPDVKLKDSGIEWLSDIPEHWEVAKLKWLSNIYSGGTPSTNIESYWTNGTIPWLNSGTVNQKRITKASEYITDVALQNSSTKWVNKGSILMALAGQGKTKGMAAMLEFDATCNQSMAAIEVDDSKAYNEFILIWLESNYLNIRSMGGGEKLDGINLQILGNIYCPLPTLDEQKEIFKHVSNLTSKIEISSEELIKSIQKLKEYRQSLISEAVTGKIDVRNWQAPKS